MYYLDNASLEKPKYINYLEEILNTYWYNPNSIYQSGIDSKKIIENAKNIISKEINCNPEELIFCSCASEANSLATCGYIRKHNKMNFITSTIEHSSISENPYGIKKITVDKFGFYNITDIKNIYNSLVSLQFANSEIGTIQDIKNIIMILHNNNCIVHIDAVASFGKMPIDVKELDVDMLSATGQKIGGILGASFLFKKKNIELEPLIFGHNTLRGGTPNVLAIASLGEAVKHINYSFITSKNRDYVYDYIVHNIPNSYLVGADLEHRLPHNLYVCLKGIQGESLMTLLDMNNIQVSTGSACASGDLTPSPTLLAIGMDMEDINSCIRMTFSGNETKEELDYVCSKLKNCIQILRNI